jgi:hypothetical protein
MARFSAGSAATGGTRMTSVNYQAREWQQRDTLFDPALVLTWVLGMAVAVFIATAF